MSLDSTTKRWLWSSLFAGLVVAGAAYGRAVRAFADWTLAGIFLALTFMLFILALRLARGRPRLNLTVAAETIVALGIFSLVISIAFAIYGTFSFVASDSVAKGMSIADIQRFAMPFLEGLTTAAIAPLVATFLRNCEASFTAAEGGEAGLTDSIGASKRLAEQLQEAVSHFGKLNAELNQHAAGFGKLTSTLQSEAERLRDALNRVQTETAGFSAAAGEGRSAVTELASNLSALGSSAKDGRTLLDALGKLIESVERFIKPEPARP